MALDDNISALATAIGTKIKTTVSNKADRSITKTLGADISTSTTSLTDISDFNVTLQANKTYQILAYMPFIHSNTGAVCKVGYTSPIDAISMLEVLTPLNTGNLAVYDYYSYLYSNNLPVQDAKAGYTLLTNGDNNPCMVKGVIKTNSAGIFTIKVGSEDGTLVTIKQSAILIVTPI